MFASAMLSGYTIALLMLNTRLMLKSPWLHAGFVNHKERKQAVCSLRSECHSDLGRTVGPGREQDGKLAVNN